jgi:hypothetical protein
MNLHSYAATLLMRNDHFGHFARPSRKTAFGWTADEARSAGFRLLMTHLRHKAGGENDSASAMQ